MTLNEFSKKLSQQKNSGSVNPNWTTIIGFQGDLRLVERLKELGFHQGLEVEVIGRAPFGGPQLFRFGNTVLALRQEEASCLLV